MAEPDIINAFFQKHYPADVADAWKSEWCGNEVCRRYTGNLSTRPNIFPKIVCADGFTLSVQGHFGAYSSPRDDFAHSYSAVEIMEEPGITRLLEYRSSVCGDKVIYAFVPTWLACELIEDHGGIDPVAALQAQCDAFNARYPVGQPVALRKDGGESVITKTRSVAEVLSGHSAVIWLEAVTGCYLLDRVSPISSGQG